MWEITVTIYTGDHSVIFTVISRTEDSILPFTKRETTIRGDSGSSPVLSITNLAVRGR